MIHNVDSLLCSNCVLFQLVPITEGPATTVTTQQTVVEVTTVTSDLQISKSEVNATTAKTRINETVRSGGIHESVGVKQESEEREELEAALPWQRRRELGEEPDRGQEEQEGASWDLVITVVATSVTCVFLLFTLAVVVRQRMTSTKRPPSLPCPDIQLAPSSSSLSSSSHHPDSVASFQQRFRHFQPELLQQQEQEHHHSTSFSEGREEQEREQEQGPSWPASCQCGVSVHYSISYTSPCPCHVSCHQLSSADHQLRGLYSVLGPSLLPNTSEPHHGAGQQKSLLDSGVMASNPPDLGPGQYRTLVKDNLVGGSGHHRRDSLVCDV